MLTEDEKRARRNAYSREYYQRNPHLRKARNARTTQETRRAWNLYAAHGIRPEVYDLLLERQGGGCGICGRVEDPTGKSLPVDHDHDSGRIRGILCTPCNRALGLFGDDMARLTAAIQYLRKMA